MNTWTIIKTMGDHTIAHFNKAINLEIGEKVSYDGRDFIVKEKVNVIDQSGLTTTYLLFATQMGKSL